MEMEPDQKVNLYLEITRRNPTADLDEISNRLVDQGLSLSDAEALIAFVPMGFAYVLLSPKGVLLSESYQVINPTTGEMRRGLLIDQPIFQAAIETADHMFGKKDTAETAYAVAKWSAEFDAVNRLCLDGAKLNEISLTEAVLARLPIDSI
jgi:hypothetical protein